MEFLWALLFTLGCIGVYILIGKLWYKLSLDKECYNCKNFRHADCDPTEFSADKCKENNFCYFKHYKLKKMKLWIARDKDGMLHLFRAKPKKYSIGFGGYNKLYVDPDKFPEVTWENSPQEVELILTDKTERNERT